jgi:arylsulfatase A-like enzyme
MFDPSGAARTMFDSLATYHAVPAPLVPRQALLRDRYDESIRYSDANVGRFLAWLRAQALFDQTLIVVTADHGESFSHGYGGHGGPGLHDELIHVPLIIKKPGQTVQEVSHEVMDQSALADLLKRDLGLPIAHTTSGTGPWPVQAWSMNFERSAAPNHRFDEGAIAAISWPWKYVAYRGTPEPGQRPVREELFDLATDPAEARDRLLDTPDVAAALRDQVDTEIRAHLPRRR